MSFPAFPPYYVGPPAQQLLPRTRERRIDNEGPPRITSISEEAREIVASMGAEIISYEDAQRSLNALEQYGGSPFSESYRVIHANPEKGVPLTIHQFNEDGVVHTVIDSGKFFPAHPQSGNKDKYTRGSVRITQAYDLRQKKRVCLKEMTHLFSKISPASYTNLRKVLEFLKGKSIEGVEETYYLSPELYKPSSKDSKTSYPTFITVSEAFDHNLAWEFEENNIGLTEEEAKDALYQIAVGLRNLHELDYSHNDFKFGNVLLKIVDGRVIVKITDFETLFRIGESRNGSEVFGTHGHLGYRYDGEINPFEKFSARLATALDDIFAFGASLENYLFENRGFFWLRQNLQGTFLRGRPMSERMKRQLFDPKMFQYKEPKDPQSFAHLTWRMLMGKVNMGEVVELWGSRTGKLFAGKEPLRLVHQPSEQESRRALKRTTSAEFRKGGVSLSGPHRQTLEHLRNKV